LRPVDYYWVERKSFFFRTLVAGLLPLTGDCHWTMPPKGIDKIDKDDARVIEVPGERSAGGLRFSPDVARLPALLTAAAQESMGPDGVVTIKTDSEAARHIRLEPVRLAKATGNIAATATVEPDTNAIAQIRLAYRHA
jgi:hypothetical protein